MSKPANTTPDSRAINAEAFRRLKYSGADVGDFLCEMGEFASNLRSIESDEDKLNEKIEEKFFHRIDVMYDNHLYDAVDSLETKLNEVIEEANDEASHFAMMTTNSRGIYIIVCDISGVLQYHFPPDTYTEEQVSAMQNAVKEISELVGLQGWLIPPMQNAFGDVQSQLDKLTIRAVAA